MTSSIERRPVVHPAERWNSPHRFVAQPRTEVLSFGEPDPVASAPAEHRLPKVGLTERLLAVWSRRLQPSTWGLLALAALNLILLPFAIAKGG